VQIELAVRLDPTLEDAWKQLMHKELWNCYNDLLKVIMSEKPPYTKAALMFMYGALEMTRTSDLTFRKRLLYPLSYERRSK
jgi:hypothetical protein